MSYNNGQLPDSVLLPVQPFGRLRRDAAQSYTDMRAAAARDGVELRPSGPGYSTYRNYAGQVVMRNMWCGQGMCYRAAVPGTSNHGWGKAVDFWMGPGVYTWLSRNASRFGWSHAEGASVGEDWHWTFVGGYKPRPRVRVLKRGSSGDSVKKLQRMLRSLHVSGAPRVTGYFGIMTKRAVIRFQKKHGLTPDGVVGPATWRALVRATSR